MSTTARLASGAAAVLLLALGGGLWARYGGAVFFDLLSASFAGCFL